MMRRYDQIFRTRFRLIVTLAGVVLVLLALNHLFSREFYSLPGMVVDEADLLTANEERMLSDRLARYEHETDNQIVIVTMKSLGGIPIETVARKVGTDWRLGRANNGKAVLILVSDADRKLRIEVGSGLQSVLTDNRCLRIIQDKMLPHLRNGEYYEGMWTGVESIIAILGDM